MENEPLTHRKHPLSIEGIGMPFSLNILFFFLLFPIFLSAQQVNPLKGKRVLVFSKTEVFRHSSIPAGVKAIKELGKQNDFQVDATENAADFTEKNLKKYQQVIFLSTTGNVLNNVQQIVFERFIQAGGSYVGIHAAADTEYDWAWYGKLVGGYFSSHPGNPNVQEGKMIVVDKNHPSTRFMQDSFFRTDEFYDFKNVDPSVKVLVLVDEKSYKDGKMGNYHPMAWCKEYDGGRSFYTNWGQMREKIPRNTALSDTMKSIKHGRRVTSVGRFLSPTIARTTSAFLPIRPSLESLLTLKNRLIIRRTTRV